MKQFFIKEVKDEDHTSTNTVQKKIFTDSTNEKTTSISHFYSPSDNQSNFSLNSYSDSIDNSSNESNHIQNNLYYNDTDENSYTSSKKNNTKNSQKKFLGKKTKIHFDVLKNCEKKRIFETRIFYGKNEHNIDDSNSNNLVKDKNILNRQNSESSESTFSIKETEKNESSAKLPQKTVKKLFSIIDYNLFDDLEKGDINEGRWSSEEHIKFIKAFVYFGKKYKLIQKYISSRNCHQIRSHAQKFVLRIKSLKNKDYDFSNYNINSLSDIIDIIEANNKTNINNKEYIINTLIDISEIIKKNGENFKVDKFKNYLGIIRKTEEKTAINVSESNDDDNEIKIEFNDKNLGKKLNNDEYSIFENEEIYEDIINSYINLMRNENINIYKKELGLEEIDINNNLNCEQKEENVPQNKEIITKEWNYLDDICNIDNILKQNDKFEDDFIFLSNDSCLFCQDEFLSMTKDNFLMKNKNSSYLKLISNLYN